MTMRIKVENRDTDPTRAAEVTCIRENGDRDEWTYHLLLAGEGCEVYISPAFELRVHEVSVEPVPAPETPETGNRAN